MLDYICDHWPKGWADASHLYENLGHQAKAIMALKGCGDAGAQIWDQRIRRYAVTPSVLPDGRAFIRVSVGQTCTEQRHVVGLWQLIDRCS